MKTIRLVFIFIVFVTIFSACKTKKSVSGYGTLPDMSEAVLIKNIEDHRFTFDHLFFKRAVLRYEDENQSFSFRANIFLKRDSFLIVSVIPAMGIEFIRVKMDKSGVEILDRRNREHVVTGYGEIYRKLFIEADFNLVQGILTNQFFTYPLSNSLSSYHINGELSNPEYSLSAKTKREYKKPFQPGLFYENVYHQVKISPDDFAIKSNILLHTGMGLKVIINYSDFVLNEDFDYFLPNTINFEAAKLDKNYLFSIRYGDVEVNGSNAISFKVPDKYETIYR